MEFIQNFFNYLNYFDCLVHLNLIGQVTIFKVAIVDACIFYILLQL
jgi:hypothetical protein